MSDRTERQTLGVKTPPSGLRASRPVASQCGADPGSCLCWRGGRDHFCPGKVVQGVGGLATLGSESASQPGGHGRLRPKCFPKVTPRSGAREPLQPDPHPGLHPGRWMPGWPQVREAPDCSRHARLLLRPHKQRFLGPPHWPPLQRASLLTKVLHGSFFLPPPLLKAGTPVKGKIHRERP